MRSRRARVKRTAKSCGPDAAVLASSCADRFLRDDGGKRAVHRGEHEVSRKATAQGRPGCSACTCMLVCAFSVRNCTRDRGCSAHPVFPAPSVFQGGQTKCQPRAQRVARSRSRIQFVGWAKRSVPTNQDEAVRRDGGHGARAPLPHPPYETEALPRTRHPRQPFNFAIQAMSTFKFLK